MLTRAILLGASLFLTGHLVVGEEIQVAVASNFAGVAEQLAAQFEGRTEHEVVLIRGATGKHFSQIHNGAPFHIFLAADLEHPRMLEDGGWAVAGSQFTYAEGQLVLWSPLDSFVDRGGKVLAAGPYRHLAVANPDLAPYGLAAREVLEALGLWQELRPRMVRGENIGQAFQFVATGNAELGFVALSQVTNPDGQMRAGSHWLVPQKLYTPIEQGALLLRDTPAAREFLGFVETDEARTLIQRYGYRTP